MTATVYRRKPQRFKCKVHYQDGVYYGVIRDYHKGVWWKTVLTYPTKRKAQKALKDAVVHLEKSQYDPTVERFDGTLPKVEA